MKILALVITSLLARANWGERKSAQSEPEFQHDAPEHSPLPPTQPQPSTSEDYVDRTAGLWDVATSGRVEKLGIEPLESSTYYFLDHDAFLKQVTEADQQAPTVVLPYFENVLSFSLADSGEQSQAISDKYPGIKSFSGKVNEGDIKATAMVDINPAGIHAQIHGPSGSFYIDPVRGAKSAAWEGLMLHRGYTPEGSAKGFNDNPMREENVVPTEKVHTTQS